MVTVSGLRLSRGRLEETHGLPLPGFHFSQDSDSTGTLTTPCNSARAVWAGHISYCVGFGPFAPCGYNSKIALRNETERVNFVINHEPSSQLVPTLS